MKGFVVGLLIVAVIGGIFIYSNKDSPNLAPPRYKPGLPDLITNITINNIVNQSTNSSALFLINYTVDYKNIGNVIAPNNTVWIASSAACPLGGGGGGGFVPISALNPNQIVSLQFSGTINCHAGTWSAYSIADYLNTVTELNENNNNATASVMT